MKGRRASTSLRRIATVDGVRAVATLNNAPLEIASFSIATVLADNRLSDDRRVPSRSLINRVFAIRFTIRKPFRLRCQFLISSHSASLTWLS